MTTEAPSSGMIRKEAGGLVIWEWPTGDVPQQADIRRAAMLAKRLED